MTASTRGRGHKQIIARHSKFTNVLLKPAHKILHNRSADGISLLVASVLTLALANSPWSGIYKELQEVVISIDLELFNLDLTLKTWVNEGLMVLFFVLVGLEIKREVVLGNLSGKKKAILPIAAALNGMLFPALLYLLINMGEETISGWGVPMATDIAFAVGIVSLFKNQIPEGVRSFILGLSIIDDIGAILVIAIFYTQDLSILAITGASAVTLLLLGLRWLGIRAILPYVFLGFILWIFFLHSGVHSTIAGVILAFLIPSKPLLDHDDYISEAENYLSSIRKAADNKDDETIETELGKIQIITNETESPLDRMERGLSPWVSYLVLPVFAFMNAGVSFSQDLVSKVFSEPLGLGIMAGLFLGKVSGIFVGSLFIVKLGLAKLPDGMEFHHVVAAGLLAGIGFTMAIFIGNLAFQSSDQLETAKIAILFASITAAICGSILLSFKKSSK